MRQYKLDDTQKSVWKEISLEYGLTMSQITEIWTNMFRFIRSKAVRLELNGITSNRELSSLKSNFNLPGLAKMYLNNKYVIKKNLIFAEKPKENNLKDE